MTYFSLCNLRYIQCTKWAEICRYTIPNFCLFLNFILAFISIYSIRLCFQFSDGISYFALISIPAHLNFHFEHWVFLYCGYIQAITCSSTPELPWHSGKYWTGLTRTDDGIRRADLSLRNFHLLHHHAPSMNTSAVSPSDARVHLPLRVACTLVMNWCWSEGLLYLKVN
jgi:hypothetical protein